MPHAIRIHHTGGPEALVLEEVPRAEPGPGEALLVQRAIGVNFIDTYHRSGLYPVSALPSGIGVEAAGTVARVGSGVSPALIGRRMAYVGGAPGAYAEERVIAADRLVSVPDAIDDATAAAVLLKGMTVEALIFHAYRVRPGQSVLLHAAAGGVGLIACQWLSRLGARVLATVGTDEKAELVRAHGASETIVYTREDFVARVRELTHGAGVPVVYDGVGRATFRGSLDCLARRGTLVVFGNASGKPEPLDVLELGRKGSLTVTRPVLFDFIATAEALARSSRAVLEAVVSGAVRVRVGARFPLADAAAAHRALEARATTGSIVLTPE